MFTRNWYKAQASHFSAESQMYKSVGGSEFQINYGYLAKGLSPGYKDGSAFSSSAHTLLTMMNGYGGAILGTGNTPPTLDDYKLSGNLVTGFSYTSSKKVTFEDNGATIEFLYTITNTTEDSIYIGEIGIISNLNGNSNGENYKALLERTVLDSPVTIPAGGVGQITYTIRMNYPT